MDFIYFGVVMLGIILLFIFALLMTDKRPRANVAPKRMKIYAIPPNGASSYLTVGKEYLIKPINNETFYLKCDVYGRDDIYCTYKNCAHLNGRDWIIKKVYK